LWRNRGGKELSRELFWSSHSGEEEKLNGGDSGKEKEKSSDTQTKGEGGLGGRQVTHGVWSFRRQRKPLTQCNSNM